MLQVLSNQIRRKSGKRTRTGLSILHLSLDSDSPFRGTSSRFTEGRRRGYKFNTSQCSNNFHKTYETSYRSIKKVRDECHNLCRRHSYFGKNQSATGKSKNTTLFLLQMLGFKINREKSKLKPVQNISFFGFEVNSANMLFKLPEEKVLKIKKKTKRLQTVV